MMVTHAIDCDLGVDCTCGAVPPDLEELLGLQEADATLAHEEAELVAAIEDVRRRRAELAPQIAEAEARLEETRRCV